MQIFAGLLRCIRNICMERFIEHLAIVDIADGSQNWYRDFFRLAGFRQCRCQRSGSSTLQLETQICLSLRRWPAEDFPTVYETVRVWLAEGRCTRALLDSVAFGEAAEVERRYFHDLLAELLNGKDVQSAQGHTERKIWDQTQSHRSRRESKRTWSTPRRKVSKPGNEVFLLRKHCSTQNGVVKSIGGSSFKARRTRKRSEKAHRQSPFCARPTNIQHD